jgi:hypothetical protein
MDDINYNNIEERLYSLVQIGMPEIQKLLFVVMVERSQLYGALIRLMEVAGIDRFEMTLDDMKESSGKKYVLFMPGDDKTSLTVSLLDRQEEPKENEPA